MAKKPDEKARPGTSASRAVSRLWPCMSPRRRGARPSRRYAPSVPLGRGGLAASRPENLDPESAAKRILEHALASSAAAALTAPKVGGAESNFKSLGVETVPLTGTSIVKFRQQLHGIPVYGSLVSVELDDDNEMVSLNSNLAAPDVPSHLAKVSPQDALKRVASEAGYGRELPDVTPVAQFLSRRQGQVASGLHRREHAQPQEPTARRRPGITGCHWSTTTSSMRSPARWSPSCRARHRWRPAPPRRRTSSARPNIRHRHHGGRSRALRDTALNIETYDFALPRPEALGKSLPGAAISAPWSTAAVSAHATRPRSRRSCATCSSATTSTTRAGALISTVNCVVEALRAPARQQELAQCVLGRQADDLRPGDCSTAGCARSPPRSTSSRTSCFTA